MTENLRVVDARCIKWAKMYSDQNIARQVRRAFEKVANDEAWLAVGGWDGAFPINMHIHPYMAGLENHARSYPGPFTFTAERVLYEVRNMHRDGVAPHLVIGPGTTAVGGVNRPEKRPRNAATAAPAAAAEDGASNAIAGTVYEQLLKIFAAPRLYNADVPKPGYTPTTTVTCDVCSATCSELYYSYEGSAQFDACKPCLDFAKKLARAFVSAPTSITHIAASSSYSTDAATGAPVIVVSSR